MSRWSALPAALALWLLAACAPLPPARPVAPLLHDERFAPPSEAVQTDPFRLSEAMQRYLATEIPRFVRLRGAQSGLLEALYERDALRLAYDASFTRDAAQAFDARSGNCLSLVVMTSALAKAMGIEVRYNSAVNADVWGRQGDLLTHSGHVNITLGRRLLDNSRLRMPSMTVDFLPPEWLGGLRTREIDEATVVAMFLNNRAVEHLVAGRLDDAYWYARESVLRDPRFASAVNTLGGLYLRRGMAIEAEAAIRHVLAAEPDNPRALGNLVEVLQAQGRSAEAQEARARLARVEPDPPYHFFRLGVAAAGRGEWALARELFEREVQRADFNPEFHHWLGIALWRLGDTEAARRELALALENSTTHGDRERYSAKLARFVELGAPTP